MVPKKVLPNMSAAIIGGIDSDYEDKHYFFTGEGNTYLRFNFDQERYLSLMLYGRLDAAHRAITESFIPELSEPMQLVPPFWYTLPESLNFTPLDAAVTYRKTLEKNDIMPRDFEISLLFKGNQVRRYLWGSDDEDALQEAVLISEYITKLPEYFHSNLDAAVMGQAQFSQYLYLFKGDQYARCTFTGKDQDIVYAGSAKISVGWPGLEDFTTGVAAVFNVFNTEKACTFPHFSTCVFVKNNPNSTHCNFSVFSWELNKKIVNRIGK